jgi:hypothetical protein
MPVKCLIAILFLLSLQAWCTTYYISPTGLDTNNGTSKSTPFLHAPGMPNCSSTCLSTTPIHGDSIIFEGGGTWTLTSTWNFGWSGISGSQIYIGVDQTWYTGGSWVRPVISGGGTFPGSAGTGNFLNLGTGSQSYVTVDNLEWTALNWSASITGLVSYIGLGGNSVNDLIEENYFHGWTHSALPVKENNGAEAVSCGGGSSISNQFFLNVVDGSDTAENSFMGVQGSCFGQVYENEFKELIYGFNGNAHSIHDNVFDHVGFASYDLVSHNGIVISNLDDSGGSVVYNNLILSGLPGATGGVSMWQTPPASTTSYAFNNVTTNTNIAGTSSWCGEYYTSGAGGGACTFFNITAECGPDSDPINACFRVGSGQVGAPIISGVNEYNIHTVYNSGGALNTISSECSGGACPVVTSNIVNQTLSAANGQGYTLSQTYPFSPTLSSNATVGAGTNEFALCAAITLVDANAGSACAKDTTLGVSYNTTNHTVSFPARTPNLRPSSGAWDAGAYQFATITNYYFTLYPGPGYDELDGAVNINGATPIPGYNYRFGYEYNTTLNPSFYVQNAITSCSQDGVYCAMTTDWQCSFGTTNGTNTSYCAPDWQASTAVAAGAFLWPQTNNAGGYVYQTSTACTMGSSRPSPFNQTVGGTPTSDGTCSWVNIGTYRGDIVIVINP